MMAEGADSTSRGHLKEGVTVGDDMLWYIPWNLLALDRTDKLKPWLTSWIGDDVEYLEPAGWFTRGHDHLGGEYDHLGFWRHKITPGRFVWAPPPAAADVALEELRKARIKRQDYTHFFIVPRFLTPEWLKQLWKTADIIIRIPPGTPGWPAAMFEPLTLGIVFPFLKNRPWQLKGTPKMFYLARQVQRMFKEEKLDPGDFLHKLLVECGRFRTMPHDVVRRMLFFRPKSEFLCQQTRKRGGRKRKRPPGPIQIGEGVGSKAPVTEGVPPCARWRPCDDSV
jgi:hypothetical protein